MTIPLVIKFITLISTSIRNFLLDKLQIWVYLFMLWDRGNILITWFVTFAFTWVTKLCFWWCKRVTHCTSSMNTRWLHRSITYCWTWKIRCNWVIDCRSWPCKCIICLRLSKGIVFVHDNWRLCMFGQRVKLIILFVNINMYYSLYLLPYSTQFLPPISTSIT